MFPEVDVIADAIHIGIGDRSHVQGQGEFLVLVPLETLGQVIFHTDTHIDAKRCEKSGDLVVGVLGVVAEQLGLEREVERIEPFVIRLVTKVGMQTQDIVTDLIVTQRVFRGGVSVGFPFQLVG